MTDDFEKVEQLFEGRSFLRPDRRMQGNRITEDGVVVFGGRAGPQVDAIQMLHEMAHFVEIDECRCRRFGWGLNFAEVEILGRLVSDPQTHQMTDRELRVTAYEVAVARMLGIDVDIVELVSSFKYLPDWSMVPSRGPDRDASLLDWCVRRVQTLLREPRFRADTFLAEWIRRDALLEADPIFGTWEHTLPALQRSTQ